MTVKFDATAALIRWNDGKRSLTGNDGFILQLDPAEWPDGERLTAAVDARIEPRYKIDIDAPGPQRPAPEGQAASADRLPSADGRPGARKAAAIRGWRTRFFAALWLLCCLVGVSTMLDRDTVRGAAVLAVGVAGVTAQRFLLYRRRRRLAGSRD